jgi:uncharacterized protein YkwD
MTPMTDAPPRTPFRRPAFRGLGLSIVLAGVLGFGLMPAIAPAPVQAGTAETMEAELLSWVNTARVNRGLVPLRLLRGLADIAGYRASVMASTGKLSHTIAGCLSCQITAKGIPWYGDGEVIAYTTWPWGDQAAKSMFDGWKRSTIHWALLMSSHFNYVGIGVAYRSANKSTWGSVVFTESPDLSPPWAKILKGSRSGTTVTWSWTGADKRLQTHTSGLKNYDVQYRRDLGTWSTIRSGTTATSLSLGSRARGHYYGLRVRSRDWRAYTSPWTAELRVWVP